MALKPIFIIGAANGKEAVIPKGINSGSRLLKHSLRLLENTQERDLISTQKIASFIDKTRTKNNMCYVYRQGSNWGEFRTFARRRDKIAYYEKFRKKQGFILANFREEWKAKKQEREKQTGNKGRYTTFTDYFATKYLVGEWILSASRDFFIKNKVIEAIDEKKFKIINQKKLLQWADCANQWGKNQIQTIYGVKHYEGAQLHLDESNVHLHVNFFRHKIFDNKKVGKIQHGFVNIDRKNLKGMHRYYRQYMNKALFQDKGWDPQYQLEATSSGEKYLSLAEYKRRQGEEKRKDIKQFEQWQQLKKNKRENLEKLAWLPKQEKIIQKSWDQEAIKEAYRKLYKGVWKNDDDLIIEAKEALINLGALTEKTVEEQITEIMNDMEQEYER